MTVLTGMRERLWTVGVMAGLALPAPLGHGAAAVAQRAAARPAGAAVCQGTPAVNDRCPVWTAAFGPGLTGGIEPDLPAVAVSPRDGTAYVASATGNSLAGGAHWRLVAYGDDGSVRWTAAPEAMGAASAVAVTPDGSRVIASGVLDNPQGLCGFETGGYSAADGHMLWAVRLLCSRYGSGVVFYCGTPSLQISPDGRQGYVTAGIELRDPGNTTMSTIYITTAYGLADGRELWSTDPIVSSAPGCFTTGAPVYPARLSALSPDGTRIFVAGETGTGPSYGTVAYDTATGARVWSQSYGPSCPPPLPKFPPDCVGYATGIGLSADGSRVYVTGQATASIAGLYSYGSIYTCATVAYAAGSGRQLWVDQLLATGGSDALDSCGQDPVLAVGHGSDVFVAISYDGVSRVLALDGASGTHRWTDDIVPSDLPSNITGLVAVPQTGRLYVLGNDGTDDGAGGSGDYVTVELAEDSGAAVWRTVYSPAGDPTVGAGASGNPTAAAADRSGARLIVTGLISSSPLGNSPSIVTAAYDTGAGPTLAPHSGGAGRARRAVDRRC